MNKSGISKRQKRSQPNRKAKSDSQADAQPEAEAHSQTASESHLDSQSESPFLKLPLELRQKIYSLYFAEEPVPDGNYVPGIEEKHFETSFKELRKDKRETGTMPNWLRPGCLTRMRIQTDLLRTCRKINEEASAVLVGETWHRCYQNFGPKCGLGQYFDQFTDKQLGQMQKFQLYTQPGDMDKNGAWLRNQLDPIAKNLRHLKITLRHLGGSPAKPMLINPFQRGAANAESVEKWMDRADNGEALQMPATSWAGAFAQLPALQSFTLEIEDEENNYYELKRLATWAMTWEFPLSDGAILSNPVSTTRDWRRPRCHCSPNYKECFTYKPPRITTYEIRWEAPPRQRPNCDDDEEDQGPARKRAKNYKRKPTGSTERFAYAPCMGGLNDMFSGASDQQIQSLISWGIL
jgi:hypothetical protein